MAGGPADPGRAPRVPCTPAADHTWSLSSAFSPCAEDSHIPTLQNHIILMRMQMKGKLWEMALDELLVKNVLPRGGVAKGRVSQARSCAEWRFLGDSRWVAHGQV